MYSFQPGIDNNISAMRKHNLTSRYSRYAGKTSKLSCSNRSSVKYNTAKYYQDSTVSSARVYPPSMTVAAAAAGRVRQYSDIASNAATACTTTNSPILFSRPRVDSKWIWQQDPLPKQPQPISYLSRMQSPYVRKLETYHGEHRPTVQHDYTAEELERINLKCKAWLESCTPWLP